MTVLYVLLVFMIVGAIVAVEITDLLSAVIAVGVVGLGLVLAFLFLQAPDLAIVQLIVEILALVILIRATVNRDDTNRKKRESFVILVYLIFAGVFLKSAYLVLNQLPEFGKPIMRTAKEYMVQGEPLNIVNSVLLNYRAYDTLGGMMVIFAAVLGIIAVTRKIGRVKK